ncbi:hypothetical protein [Aquimarina celericrescens]|uniref:Restriction endonuclease n=1 Tax=Aquimarina celericrescens TaxID=1964542 RepID=A0ABW5AWD1_9FLAO|nr:hypothetical protein [Aquimarina celericrescens]
MDISNLRKTAREYLLARKKFLDIADKTTELSGNDNIVGRIGEFLAYQFLKNEGRNPKKNNNSSEKGYDLICEDEMRISVKTITSENKSKRTTRIKEPWDEIILIQINEQVEIEQLGQLNKIQFEQALSDNPSWSNEPYCKLSMLGRNGLIGKYGVVISGIELNDKNVFL